MFWDVGHDSWMYAVVTASDSGFVNVGGIRVPLCNTQIVHSCAKVNTVNAKVFLQHECVEHTRALTTLCMAAVNVLFDQRNTTVHVNNCFV